MIAMPVPKRRTARRAPVGLTHEKIVAAALKLIDKEGIDNFSTRKIGRALRCEAMAIYYYYPSKDALLDAVVERLVAPLATAVDPAAADWVDAMRGVARAYRRIAHAHPRAFPLLATRRFASAGAYAFLEQLFTLGRTHGIPDRTAARVYRAVSSYCNGFGLNELAAMREQSDRSIAAMRAGYPAVDAVFAYLGPDHTDDTFEYGLELILRELDDQPRKRR
jgi:AcrR family transcriptional regulator